MMRLTPWQGASCVLLRRAVLAGGLILLPALAATADAQAPIPLMAGQTVSGSLSSSDAQLGDGSFYDLYIVETSPGDRFSVTVRSSDFDAYVSVGQGRTADTFTMVDSNDDGASGTDSHLEIVSEGGPYLIRANSLFGGSTGSYSITVDGSIITPLESGTTLSAQLTSRDRQMGDGSYYDQYRFHGRAGEQVEVTMRSSDFDTFLGLGRDSNGELESAEFNDDGADGTNSRLSMTLPSTGYYLVRANSLMGDRTGAYTIRLDRHGVGPVGSPVAATILLGQVMSGTLSSSDATLGDGSYYKEYRFDAMQGDRLVISLDSDDFDPYLILGRLNGGSFDQVASDDDSGSGVNARIEYEVTASGTYVIRANSWQEGSTGRFTLSLGRR